MSHDVPLDVAAAAQMELVLIEIKATNRFLSNVVENNRQDVSLEPGSKEKNKDKDTSRALLQELQRLRTLREAEQGMKVILPLTPSPRPGSPNYCLLSVVLVLMVLFFIVFVR